MLALHGKAVEPAEAETVEPFQRVPHRRAGGKGASLSLADESIAASLPTEEDARREVEEVASLPPRLYQVARAPRSRGVVFWWPPHSPAIPHASGRDSNDRCGRHRPHAHCHLVRGDAPGDREGNLQGTGRCRLLTHLLFNRRKYAQVPKVARSYYDFAKSGRHSRNLLWRSLNGH